MNTKTKYLPEGRAPNNEDLAKLIQTNPIARACYALSERGDITKEESLLATVLALADDNERLTLQLLEVLLTQEIKVMAG